MAHEPPTELSRPPDEAQTERLNVSNKTQSATLSNSSHNSTNSQNTGAISTTNSVKELEGTRQIISPGTADSIHEKLIGDKESPSLDSHHSKKLADFAVPIDSNQEATLARSANESPEMRRQIRTISSQVREDSNTRDYSPNEEVHLPGISGKMDGRFVNGENFGENRLQTAGVNEKSRNGNHSPPLGTHLSDISFIVDEGNNNNNQSTPPAESVMSLNKEANRNGQETDKNGSFTAPLVGYSSQLDMIHSAGATTMQRKTNLMQQRELNEQQNNEQNSKKQPSEILSDATQSSNFSFGIENNSLNLTSNPFPCVIQDTDQDKSTEKPECCEDL